MMRDMIARKDGAVAIISPIYDQIPATIWGTQTAGIVSSIDYLLSPDVIVNLLRAENAEVLVVPNRVRKPLVGSMKKRNVYPQ
ncbi:MAG: Acyl-CoA synthetase (AMP-forming)/AMP-acid ligase II [Syntrophaceae bacterium]|nr:MAG: Acyl-CoA synthetase (AMP-forming)/AMP-acid ligase II [Syntrophaceae bacterium]